MAGPRQGPLMPVNKAPVMPHAVDPAPAPAPIEEVAPSPFQGESKELDYAELMLKNLEHWERWRPAGSDRYTLAAETAAVPVAPCLYPQRATGVQSRLGWIVSW